jgi:hypothetical protein
MAHTRDHLNKTQRNRHNKYMNNHQIIIINVTTTLTVAHAEVTRQGKAAQKTRADIAVHNSHGRTNRKGPKRGDHPSRPFRNTDGDKSENHNNNKIDPTTGVSI